MTNKQTNNLTNILTSALVIAASTHSIQMTSAYANSQPSRSAFGVHKTTRTGSGPLNIATPLSLLDLDRTSDSFLQEQHTILEDISTSMASSASVAVPLPVPEPILEQTPKKTKGKPGLNTWKRRLNTHEDKFNVHKYSGSAFVLSSMVILGTGVFTGFEQIPDYLGPVTNVFVLSSLVQTYSSVQMALTHRKSDPSVRSAFVGGAAATVLTISIGYWLSPFCNEYLAENADVSNAIFATLSGVCALTALDGIVNTKGILDSRTKKNDDINVVADWLSYVAVFYAGLFFAGESFMHSFDPEHTRAFVAEHILGPNAMNPAYYNLIIQACCTSYSAFFITIRDKKLINKSTERMALGVMTAVAFVFQFHLQDILSHQDLM